MPLTNEIQLLLRSAYWHNIPAQPIIRQLAADGERPLPDAIPPQPQWVAFQWPKSGEVDLRSYWRGRENGFWNGETI